ncbi:MAG: hypothetical protein J5804_04140, partial [Eggerthellaceae bacterium]|nr:hypothetical protein [Eggerthellaceae bacterium]
NGLTVFPVVMEDLYERGGLDRVMLQVVETIEQETGRKLVMQRKALDSADLCEARYQLLLSLLPGNHERNISPGHFICGHRVIEGKLDIFECVIEF